MVNYRLLPLFLGSRAPGIRNLPTTCPSCTKAVCLDFPLKNKYKYKYWSCLGPRFCGMASIDLSELGLIR